MAVRRKKIETMRVSLSDLGITFPQVLNSVLNMNYDEGNGKLLSLHKISETNDYFQGYVNTTRRTGIPPKHNPTQNTFEQIQINVEDGEGLGYANVFIYDKRYGILMYEFNKNGCYLSSFRRYIVNIFNETSNGIIDFSFAPLLRIEAYQRMLNLDLYKRIDVKIANPTVQIQDFLDENDAISSAINTCQLLNSDTVDLTFDIKGRPIEGMPNQIVSNFIRRIHRLATDFDQKIVEKFTISGYYQDIEDDVTKRDEIDLLLDRYHKTFSIDEPEVQSDPQIREKSTSLFEVYVECRDDFSILAPIQ